MIYSRESYKFEVWVLNFDIVYAFAINQCERSAFQSTFVFSGPVHIIKSFFIKITNKVYGLKMNSIYDIHHKPPLLNLCLTNRTKATRKAMSTLAGICVRKIHRVDMYLPHTISLCVSFAVCWQFYVRKLIAYLRSLFIMAVENHLTRPVGW